MRAALLRDDLVENVIEAGPDFDPGDGLIIEFLEDGEFVGPGWTRSGEDWLPPGVEESPEPEPSELDLVRADLDWLINFVITGEA